MRTCAQILTAAAEVFAQKGFSHTTLLDIADQAGVTKGAVYFHYANKAAIAIAVAEDYYAAIPALADEVRSRNLSPLDATAEFLTRTATSLRDDRLFRAATRLHIESFLITEALPTPFLDYTRFLQEFLDQAKEQGQLREGCQPAVLARVLISALFGAQHISWVLHDRVDITERVQEVIDVVIPQCRAGLGGPRSGGAAAGDRTAG